MSLKFNRKLLEKFYFLLCQKTDLLKKQTDDLELQTLMNLKASFLKDFNHLYSEDFDLMISEAAALTNTEAIEKELNQEEIQAELFTFIWEEEKDILKLKKMIQNFKNSYEYGVCFLNFWNLKYEMIRELVPALPLTGKILDLVKSQHNLSVYQFEGILAQAASSERKIFPVKYGEISIEKKTSSNDFWTVSFTEIDENTLRLVVFTKLSTKGRKLQLFLSDEKKSYKIADLDNIEENGKREFEIQISKIPLCPWKINLTQYSHKIYIEEIVE